MAKAKTVVLSDAEALNVANIMVNANDFDNASELLNEILQSADAEIRTAALFELGRIAVKQADYPTAQKYFLAILRFHPGATFVRLELAKSYLLSGEYNLAEFHLRLVLADNGLSADIQEQLHKLITYSRQQKTWNISVGMSIVPDSNMNYATGNSEECIYTDFGLLCRDLAQKSSGVGLEYNLGGDYYVKLTEKIGIKTSAYLSALDFSASQFDEYMLYMAVGPRYMLGKLGELSLQPFVRMNWYGGNYYSTTPGVRFDTEFDITRRLQLITGSEFSIDAYHDKNTDNLLHGNNYSVYVQPRYYINSKSLILGGVSYQVSQANVRAYGYDSWTYSIGYFGDLPWTLGIYAKFDLTRTKYKDKLLFINRESFLDYFTRRDTNYRLYVRLSSRLLEYKRLYPSISYTYTNRDSNVPVYNFDKHRVQIELNYRF